MPEYSSRIAKTLTIGTDQKGTGTNWLAHGRGILMAASLPTEIIDVLRTQPGYSICVKGPPGSCKTALILTLLRHLSPEHNGVYVSARVDLNKLHRTFPWVESSLLQSSIIDAMACNAESDGSAFELLKYRTNLGLAQSIYQKISTLQDPIVFVDSWTEIVRIASGSSKDLFDMFCDLCLEQRARMVLVVETSNQTDLDHLVDGLIEMGTVERRGYIYRYLQIRKLSGVPHDLRKQLVEVDGEGLKVKGPLDGPKTMAEGNAANAVCLEEVRGDGRTPVEGA